MEIDLSDAAIRTAAEIGHSTSLTDEQLINSEKILYFIMKYLDARGDAGIIQLPLIMDLNSIRSMRFHRKFK